jgi:hypothetical protein
VTELTRLFETTEDPLEHALLSSALEEQPSTSGLQEAALALGLTAATAKALAATLPMAKGVGATAAVSASACLAPGGLTAGASTAVGAGTAGTTAAWGASLLVVTKGVVGGAIASFLAIGALQHALDPAPPSLTPTPSQTFATRVDVGRQAAAQPAPVTGREREATPVPASQPSAHAPPAARRASPAPVAVAHSAPPEVVTTPTTSASASFAPPPAPPRAASAAPSGSAPLAAEIRLLDQARAALARRDLEQASRLLDAYAKSRPSGVLTREATLLRARLLLAQRQKSAAAAAARAFVVQHPESADAELRELANEP